MKEITLAIVKPDGVKKRLIGECIKRIENEEMEIVEIKVVKFDRKKAEDFRKEIKLKHPSIYESLIEYMTEGPMVALVLEGENAVARLREICGPTNPKEAKKGTIRGDFAEEDMNDLYKQGKVVKNIIHASANEKEAKEEIELIFEEKH